MAKFVYRMQNILDIKMKLEDQARLSFSQANAKLVEEQQKLQGILVRKAGYEKIAQDLVNGSINIQNIQENKRAIDAMKSSMRMQLLQVQVAEKNQEAARIHLNAVMMERKTHEKLREHAFDQFKQELSHEESKAVDELVSYTYQREKN